MGRSEKLPQMSLMKDFAIMQLPFHVFMLPRVNYIGGQLLICCTYLLGPESLVYPTTTHFIICVEEAYMFAPRLFSKPGLKICSGLPSATSIRAGVTCGGKGSLVD